MTARRLAHVTALIVALVLASGARSSAFVPPNVRGGCPGGMRAVPGGEYTLVETSTEAKVSSFCLDVTEVTVAAFQSCVSSGACKAPTPECIDPELAPAGIVGCSGYCNVGHADRLGHPINCVSWFQATSYCDALGKRLPTEEEWEWAARAASKGTLFPWGNDSPDDDKICWSAKVARQTTCDAGLFLAGASPQGILDLVGSLNEWTSTHVGDKTNRIYRGGSWYSDLPPKVSASRRYSEPETNKSNTLGFRCAADR